MHPEKANIISVISTKGGVGKTTTTANLGGILADLGLRVLLIDADIQPSLSSYFLFQSAPSPQGLRCLMTESMGMNKDELHQAVINPTQISGLDVIYSDAGLDLQQWILHTPDGRTRLKQVLQTHFVDAYDIILIDSQGADSPLQHAAVLAADQLISPINPQSLTTVEFMRGTLGMLQALQPLAAWGGGLGSLSGLIYRLDHTRSARDITREIEDGLFDDSGIPIDVLQTRIPDRVAYKNASDRNMPVHKIGESHALESVLSLVQELFPHLTEQCQSFRNQVEG